MKGEDILYKSVIPSSLPKEKGEFQKQHTYLETRHNVMAARYYYHTAICRLRYDDTIVQLHKEFHLSPNTVIINLKLRLYAINTMVENTTTIQQLKQEYPWFVWDGKPLAVHAN